MSQPGGIASAGTSGRLRSLAGYARGPATVAAGAVLLGVGSYVFLTLAARSLGPGPFGDLSTMWALVFGFVAGLWYPFEQVLTRVVAAGRAHTGADVRRVALIQAVAVGAAQLVVVLLLLSGSDVLGKNNGLAAGLMLSVLTLSITSYQRGLLIGAGRYGWAAVQQSVDGLARALGAIALFAAGTGVGPYGVLLGLAPLVGVLAAIGGTPLPARLLPADRTWGALVHDIGGLLAGTYASIVLLNVGPLVVRSSGTAEATGRFMAVFVIARLPLFFAPPVVSGLLPTLVQAHETGPPERFRRLVRTMSLLVGAVAAVGCLALGLLGPWIARTFFGSEYEADLGVSVMLSLSSAGFVVAMLLQGALVASGRPRAVAGPWLVAAAAFAVLCVAVPGSIDTRVSLAYLLSSFVALAAMATALLRERTTA